MKRYKNQLYLFYIIMLIMCVIVYYVIIYWNKCKKYCEYIYWENDIDAVDCIYQCKWD